LNSAIHSILQWGLSLPYEDRNRLIAHLQGIQRNLASDSIPGFEHNLNPDLQEALSGLSDKGKFDFQTLSWEAWAILPTLLAEALSLASLEKTKTPDSLLPRLNAFCTAALPCLSRQDDLLNASQALISRAIRVIWKVHDGFRMETGSRDIVFERLVRLILEEDIHALEPVENFPLTDWFQPDSGTSWEMRRIAGRLLNIGIKVAQTEASLLQGTQPALAIGMRLMWEAYTRSLHAGHPLRHFQGKAEMVLEGLHRNPLLADQSSHGAPVLQEVVEIMERLCNQLPEAWNLQPAMVTLLAEKYLTLCTDHPWVLRPCLFNGQNLSLPEHAIHLIVDTSWGSRLSSGMMPDIEGFRFLLSYSFERWLPHLPDTLGLTLLRILAASGISSHRLNHPGVVTLQRMEEEVFSLFLRHPTLIGSDIDWFSLFCGVKEALEAAEIPPEGLLPELSRMVFVRTAENIPLGVTLKLEKVEGYPILFILREILKTLTPAGLSQQTLTRLTRTQLLSLTGQLLEATIGNPTWQHLAAEGKPMFCEVLSIPVGTLNRIPSTQGLGGDWLRQVMETSIAAVEQSPHLLDRIIYGEHPAEKTVLEHTFDLVIGWLFPPGEAAGLHKTRQLMEVLTYAVEELVSENPNSKGLAILELILSDAVGLNLSNGIIEEQTDELVDAVLLAIATQPELIHEAPGLREITQESAGAIHLLSVDHPEIGLEILRSLFEESAGRLTILLEVNGNQFRHLLIEALQQFATALCRERKQGRYSIKLSEDQLLDLVQITFEGVVEQPDWVEGESISRVLDAILEAVDARSGGRRIPYLIVALLFQNLLPMARGREELLERLPSSSRNGTLAITFLVDKLLGLLLELDLKDWRKVTQDEAIEAIVYYYLGLLDQWNLNSTSIELALNQLKQLVRQFATGSISLDEFLDTLRGEEDDDDDD